MKISGIVQKHKGRGKKLGFPTANIDIGRGVDIEDGIYAGTVGPTELPALVFVGAALTFGDTKRQAEIYILDFEGDLYGQEIEVEILKKIRDNKKFGSDAELVAQMRGDKKQAREYFEKERI
ncbi:MAG: riboflavin kinase [bacterium]|nr:riboflavin kinase [bacterium]